MNLLNAGGFYGGYYSSILITLFENTGSLGHLFSVDGQSSILIQLQWGHIFLNLFDITVLIFMIHAAHEKKKEKYLWYMLSFLTYFDSDYQVLVNLDLAVIPHMSNPIMLWWTQILNRFSVLLDLYAFVLVRTLILFLTISSDFLTRSYDIGGVISVMALSSLFVLMTQHGLEYPNFYQKLYALLVPSIFMAKHRAKFFQVIDLSSLFFSEV